MAPLRCPVQLWELGCGAAGTTQGSAWPSWSNLDVLGLGIAPCAMAGPAEELHPSHPDPAGEGAVGALPAGGSEAAAGYVPEFGVVGELVWLFWTAAATACAAVTAVFAA